MKLPSTSAGKKIPMAITGQLMILFLFVHAIGNSMIYVSRLNAYAENLQSLFLLLWGNRLLMLAALILHVFFAVQVYFENRAAKPGSYAVRKDLRATFASKNMIWAGLVIGVFLIYHLLHFTAQVTNPETAASINPDSAGRPDVSGMVIAGFQNVFISIVYIVSMAALLLHLTHGIQSSFQTLGLNSEKSEPIIIKTGSIAAIILFLAFISVPLTIFIGMIRG
jgi:succinate dehydrogenase / fumarate reductase cytochrome b subunit